MENTPTLNRLASLNSHFAPNSSAKNIWHSKYQGSINENMILRKESDSKTIFRWLSRDDYKKGFPIVLSGLTKGCDYSEQEF